MAQNGLHQSFSHSSSFACYTNAGKKKEKGEQVIFISLLKEMEPSDHTFSLEKKQNATNTHDQNIVFSKHNRMIATV